MPSIAVVQLTCPKCSRPLHGSPQAILFWCERCRTLFEVEEESLVARRMETAQPRLPSPGRLVHLPVWAFRVRASWTWPEAPAQPILAWKPPKWVYVTAFAISNAFYFGDPGLLFTQKHVELAAGDRAPLAGGTRSRTEAEAFVEFHLLNLLDRRADVTGVELQCAVDDAVLWGIPSYDDGLTLVDGILGLKIPGAALEEIGALRPYWEGRQ